MSHRTRPHIRLKEIQEGFEVHGWRCPKCKFKIDEPNPLKINPLDDCEGCGRPVGEYLPILRQIVK